MILQGRVTDIERVLATTGRFVSFFETRRLQNIHILL
jgi:hypothetical protein